MSLSALKITPAQFDELCGHILNHKPAHANLHLRDIKIVKGERVMRHLTLLRALSKTVIECVVSGDIYLRFQINKLPSGQTQIDLIEDEGDEKIIDRFWVRFFKEAMSRVKYEKSGETNRPKYKQNQFYIKRGLPGTPFDHETCQQALKNQKLHEGFLKLLEPWNFSLIQGRK